MFKKVVLITMLLITCFVLSGCWKTSTNYDHAFGKYRYKQMVAGGFKSVELTSRKPLEVANQLESVKRERFETIIKGQSWSREQINDTPLTRDLAFVWGEGDIWYHVYLADGYPSFVDTTFSLSTFIGYHYSYLVNLPAKLVANFRTNFVMVGDGEYEHSIWTAILYCLFDLLTLIVGLLAWIVNLIRGFLVAFFCSPIRTFIDLPFVLWEMLKTTYYAFANFFYR